jgi:hypothetical protein
MTGSEEQTKLEAGAAVAPTLWREIELYLAFWAIAQAPARPTSPGGRLCSASSHRA